MSTFPAMDIHRSRFVPFPPSAINALAFSHEPRDGEREPECLRLAIGRANGNIEIWNPADGEWLQERVFYGGKDRSVEGLAWTQEADTKDRRGVKVPGRLRLFSIGYSSSVTEWDLTTGLPARNSNGNHSEVWCFAAQPAIQNDQAPQKLIAGCADGTLVLLSTADNDLQFEKFVARSTTKKARALSVTFKDRKIALAGFADSTIRVYDTRNGYVIRNISLGNLGPGGPRETLVWKVKCLANGDFVSGDSNGDICIYDGKNYSQSQRISGHEADVLDLAVSRDGSMIFSGGMDRRTCLYTSSTKTGGGKWVKVSHQRYHDHDVKAMATYDGTKLSILVSGGIDTRPIVLPIRSFGKELSRGLPSLPHSPPLVSAPEARLVVSWWNSEIRIWRVKNQDDGTEKPKVAARLALQGDENISSVAMSKDGGLLAVATSREVKLFQLVQTKAEGSFNLRIRKLEASLANGARLVQFTPDGKWLAYITAANDIFLSRIIRTDDPTERPRALPKLLRLQRLQRDFETSPLDGLSGAYSRSISHAEFSDDGSVFAVADLAGYIDTWVTEGHEDPTALEVDIVNDADDDADDSDDEDSRPERVSFLGQRWIRNPSAHLLPRLDSKPVLLSFQPSPKDLQRPEPNGNPAVHPTRRNPHPHSHDIPDTEHRLLVVSANNQLNLFDVLAGRLSEWSRRNPPSSYPTAYRLLKSPAKGCLWDTQEHQRLWLYGESWLFMFDLSHDLPIPDSLDESEQQTSKSSKKRKRDRENNNTASHKGTSGAGDAIPDTDIPITKMRKFQNSDNTKGGEITSRSNNWGASGSIASDNDDDDEYATLTALRRAGTTTSSNGAVPNGGTSNGTTTTTTTTKSSEDQAGDDEDEEGNLTVAVKDGSSKRGQEHWWYTLKYRPILGVVPLCGGGGSRESEVEGELAESEKDPLEVMLVERPAWDLDLPPRFVGAHE
ncbi:WD40 repeat-like protein [Periconia macrospinosa]|uniref:WD40 repeat-like protein n=1 Tax=Periconia macrospinosa TaxID=97972 RepID=A0A2V1D4F4_9PLEO|nr:WD40 repeat-like protein [Periconia macrospinosa]